VSGQFHVPVALPLRKQPPPRYSLGRRLVGPLPGFELRSFIRGLVAISTELSRPLKLLVKLKVKLSLCLNKHQAMKTYWEVEL
jgi:hypothetical protein